MEDRLGELLQYGKGNPFLNEPSAEDQEPFMDEFFAKVDQIRAQIKQMRAGVIELKQDYAAALDQVQFPLLQQLETFLLTSPWRCLSTVCPSFFEFLIQFQYFNVSKLIPMPQLILQFDFETLLDFEDCRRDFACAPSLDECSLAFLSCLQRPQVISTFKYFK